jgi:flagellar hook-length control protein FliK
VIGAALTTMPVTTAAGPAPPRDAGAGDEMAGGLRARAPAPRSAKDTAKPVTAHDASPQVPAPPTDDAPAGETTPLSASKQRDDAQARKERDGAGVKRDFATLLAASSPNPKPASAAAEAAPTKAAPAADATEPPAATLPDRLLALLSGMPTTPARHAPNVATPGPAPSTSAAALPIRDANMDALPVATTAAPGLPLPAANNSDAAAPDNVAALSKPAAAPGDALPAATTSTAVNAAIEATGERFATLVKFATDAIGAATPTEPATSGGPRAADAATSPDTLAMSTTSPLAVATRAVAVPPTTALALPADPGAGFDDGFGTRIAWMAEQRIGHAEIRLNPEHVGPIEVRVQLDGNRVMAEFHSVHAEVRHAIEASMPRLRELLGQHGLQLGQADVGQQPSGQAFRGRGTNGDHDARAANDETHLPTTTPSLQRRGLLDEYA